MSGPAPSLRVWDRLVRVLHWVLVLAVAGGWLSTFWLGFTHQPVGYLALAAVLLRVVWGCTGSRYARFTQFLRSPRMTLAYLGLLLRHREPRYLGHNPLGGWMIVALMGCVIGLAVTGWLYTTDWFWGDELVDQLHQALAWTLLGLAALHVLGVVFTSWRHRENLVRAMVDGRKRGPDAHDIH
ncbi:cytochrome b/b6 domain-containing protein [Aquabacterium sp.]|uniref:cytochrome b/b6 domain-containing protein n=1 Tax=Aquabacterium sp. TaxID=1872578 RepID=UPI002C5A2165|nr:cytochrome b/b6 domain-containing protein [Aquabacterium sp.]HSW03500.1 cytochrome b/b6 domain-containing protein [Aquabacterium sp.]